MTNEILAFGGLIPRCLRFIAFAVRAGRTPAKSGIAAVGSCYEYQT
jgi:hypothetical protein